MNQTQFDRERERLEAESRAMVLLGVFVIAAACLARAARLAGWL